MKLSSGKVSLPGRKQVFRSFDESGYMIEDVIGCWDEGIEGTEPLLMKVMEGGAPVGEMPSLDAIRDLCRSELSRLPDRYKDLYNPDTYPVVQSSRLARLSEAIASTLHERFGA